MLKRALVLLVVAVLLIPALTVTNKSLTPAAQSYLGIDGSGYEWSYESVDALDDLDDDVKYTSFYEDSRDLVAAYYAAGPDGGYWRVDLLDLAYGAEVASGTDVSDALDLYILIGWSNAPGYQGWLPDFIKDPNGNGVYIPSDNYQWVLVICVYDTGNYKVMDYNWNTVADQSSGQVKVAFTSQWDFIELWVSSDVLSNYGWSQNTQVWYRVVTTWTDSSGNKWLGDVIHNDDFSDDTWDSPPIFSTDNVGTAKVAFVHHGNQALTDNRALNDPNSTNSYWYILKIHENVSDLANRPIPVTIHMSGTLLSSFLWWQPEFIDYVKNLTDAGVVELIGGVWAEYITAYFPDDINRPSIEYYSGMLNRTFGVTPVIAWIPERTWDDNRTGIAGTLASAGIKAVILDGNTHHDDWDGDGNHWKPHRYNTTYTGGANLWVFFIDWNMQQYVLSNTDGGADINLRREWAWFAKNGDQHHVLIYADDWEKAAGVAGWDAGNPERYEATIRWVAQHPWIQVVRLGDVVSWLEAGDWTYDDGYYCGYDTYQYIKDWVQDYPYDYRRAYDGWYWGTSSEEAYSSLGPDSSPALAENVKSVGDVWTSGTVLGDLYTALRNAPSNHFRDLAMLTLWAMAYETAWHDDADWDGDGLQDVSGWEMAFAQRLRYTNVLIEAANWLASPSTGARLEDIDWDGVDEVVLTSDRFMAVIDPVGGTVPWAFAVGPDGVPYQVVGPTMDYYTGDCCRPDYWNGSTAHVGLFDDKWLDALSKDYSGDTYTIKAYGTDARGCAYATLTSPDGVIEKTIRACPGYEGVVAEYSINATKIQELGGPLPANLYIRFSASPDVEDLLLGDDVSISTPYGPTTPYVEVSNPSARAGRDVTLAVSVNQTSAGYQNIYNVGNYEKWTMKYVWEYRIELPSTGTYNLTIAAASDPTQAPQPVPEPWAVSAIILAVTVSMVLWLVRASRE